MREVKCKRCGKCCEAIIITYRSYQTPVHEIVADRHEIDEWPEDWKFVYRNFEEITEKEALEINPWLKEWDIKADGNMRYYTCKRYDKLTKTCSIHKIRPKVCKNFPRYGRVKTVSQCLYSANCSFHKETDWLYNRYKI